MSPSSRFVELETSHELINPELVVSPAPGISWEQLTISYRKPGHVLNLTLDKPAAVLLYRELRSRLTGDDRYA